MKRLLQGFLIGLNRGGYTMRRLHLWMSLLIALVLVNVIALPVLAQLDTGIIEGTVKDSSGAAVPKAAVTITETQTNIRFSALTDAQGRLCIAAAQGFRHLHGAACRGDRLQVRMSARASCYRCRIVFVWTRSWRWERAPML